MEAEPFKKKPHLLPSSWIRRESIYVKGKTNAPSPNVVASAESIGSQAAKEKFRIDQEVDSKPMIKDDPLVDDLEIAVTPLGIKILKAKFGPPNAENVDLFERNFRLISIPFAIALFCIILGIIFFGAISLLIVLWTYINNFLNPSPLQVIGLSHLALEKVEIMMREMEEMKDLLKSLSD